MGRPVVLTLCDHYLPGYRAGGPITSVANLVGQLSDEFQFRIVTRDRDLGERRPFRGIEPHRWHSVDPAAVCYLPADRSLPMAVRTLLRGEMYDVLYLNSLFSPVFAIWPLVLRRFDGMRPKPVVLAPRGELSAGAVRLKQTKKLTYLRAARRLDLLAGVTWQASADEERDDIRRHFGGSACVFVAPDLPSNPLGHTTRPAPPKSAGTLRPLFLSRISPKKNLLGAIEMLAGLGGRVELTIAGPLEDASYWQRCQRAIAALPGHVHVHYAGSVEPVEVPRLMAEHDVFLLPTWGENFGHVILEALSAGCPVVISDRTPWRDLAEHRAGWDLPLEEPGRFRDVLQHCVDLDAGSFAQLRHAAREYALGHLATSQQVVEQNRALFRQAIWGDRPGAEAFGVRVAGRSKAA